MKGYYCVLSATTHEVLEDNSGSKFFRYLREARETAAGLVEGGAKDVYVCQVLGTYKRSVSNDFDQER